MRMNHGTNNLGKIVLFFIMIGWIFYPSPVKAAQLYFPYYADTWPQIETKDIGILLLQRSTARKDDSEKAVAEKKANNKKRQKKKKQQKKKQKESGEGVLSAKDKEILYKVVSMECDTGYEGSLAVISCMLNRQASRKYPDDLMDVVREDSQFTAYYDKETGTYPYIDREPSKECIAAVNDALEKGKRNIPSYIYYFRSSDYDYLNGYITYGQIGDNTYFYQYEDQ